MDDLMDDRPATRQDAWEWYDALRRRLGGAPDELRDESGSPGPPAPGSPSPVSPAAEEHLAVAGGRVIEQARAHEAEELRLARTFLEERGGLPADVVGALTDAEVRQWLDEGALGQDAGANNPTDNAARALRRGSGTGLVDDEEVAKRRAAAEVTVPEEVLRQRREVGT